MNQEDVSNNNVMASYDLAGLISDTQRKEMFTFFQGGNRHRSGFGRFRMKDATEAGKISCSFDHDKRMATSIEIENPEVDPVKLCMEIIQHHKDNPTLKYFRARQGNDKGYSLTRIEREAPELWEDVCAKRISVNEAMIKAGLRENRQVYMPKDPAEAAMKIIDQFGDDYFMELTNSGLAMLKEVSDYLAQQSIKNNNVMLAPPPPPHRWQQGRSNFDNNVIEV
jgi:hypothetical protein